MSLSLSKSLAALAAAVVFAWLGVAAADVLKDRQETMEGQGDAMKRIKAYIDDKAGLAEAQQAAADLSRSTQKIPDLFPPGTGAASPDGKFRPKPEVWTQWDKFLAAQKTAVAKADALAAAAKGGDKAAIAAAFGDLGKNGCGGCHTDFREKLSD
jgi:cytochrome c556